MEKAASSNPFLELLYAKIKRGHAAINDRGRRDPRKAETSCGHPPKWSVRVQGKKHITTVTIKWIVQMALLKQANCRQKRNIVLLAMVHRAKNVLRERRRPVETVACWISKKFAAQHMGPERKCHHFGKRNISFKQKGHIHASKRFHPYRIFTDTKTVACCLLPTHHFWLLQW